MTAYSIGMKDGKGRRHRALIHTRAAALLDYSVDELNVVMSFEGESDDPFSSVFSGMSIFPWPNRLEDGKYSFQGQSYECPVNEPEKRTRLHGLSPGIEFVKLSEIAGPGSERECIGTGLRLRAEPAPCPCYPFSIETLIEYELREDDGRVRLYTTVDVKNTGAQPAPWGFCLHPWFNIRGDFTDASLSVPAEKYVKVNERSLPIGLRESCELPVSGDFDLRTAKSIPGSEAYDHAFVNLHYEEDCASCILHGADGHSTRVAAVSIRSLPPLSFST